MIFTVLYDTKMAKIGDSENKYAAAKFEELSKKYPWVLKHVIDFIINYLQSHELSIGAETVQFEKFVYTIEGFYPDTMTLNDAARIFDLCKNVKAFYIDDGSDEYRKFNFTFEWYERTFGRRPYDESAARAIEKFNSARKGGHKG